MEQDLKKKAVGLVMLLLDDTDESEADSSSDSDSSSDDEFLYEILDEGEHPHTRIKNYVNITVNSYSEVAFQSHFRMSKKSVEEICNVIHNDYNTSKYRPRVPCISAVLMTVWYLANMECLRSVGDRFNFNKGHTHTILMYVVDLLIKHIDHWVKWPTGATAILNCEKFNSINGNVVPGVFGCLDGTHIQIQKPKNDNSYINRHRYASINVQAICDSSKKFIYIFCGWPGSAHDSRVWSNSPKFRQLETSRDEVLPPGTFILSDSAYELRTFNITPYKVYAPLGRADKKFNRWHSSIRVLIEQAFGRLKGIFRRLKLLECKKVENSSKLVMVGCIFHNIAIDDHIDFEYNEVEEEEELQPPQPEEETQNENHERLMDKREAISLRNRLKELF